LLASIGRFEAEKISIKGVTVLSGTIESGEACSWPATRIKRRRVFIKGPFVVIMDYSGISGGGSEKITL
jgi:hypothetical protein